MDASSQCPESRNACFFECCGWPYTREFDVGKDFRGSARDIEVGIEVPGDVLTAYAHLAKGTTCTTTAAAEPATSSAS